MHIRTLFLLSLLLIFVAQCSKVATTTKAKPNPQAIAKVVTADNQFGFKLFNQLVGEEQDKNIFISPLSVTMALSMTMNGAGGETRKTMEEALELSGISEENRNAVYQSLIDTLMNLDEAVQFEIANSIWYRDDFQVNDQFINTNESIFDAKISELNFKNPKAVDTINRWVNQNTNGKIPTIIDQINPLDVMFLINAIYFKGNWSEQFKEKSTHKEEFYLPDNTTKQCDMMYQRDDFRYTENEQIQIIELPYGKRSFSMVIVLPRKNVNLDSLITEMNPKQWNEWQDQLVSEEVSLYLPKFKLEYEKTLTDILKQMGMEIAFTPRANFDGINKNKDVYISKVKHKTFVEVNEQGTEAAAATSVHVMLAAVRESYVMKINRPFIFAIQEKKYNSLLFIGKIVDPT